MTLNDLWDWLIAQGVLGPRFKDSPEKGESPNTKPKAWYYDPDMVLKPHAMEPNPLASTYRYPTKVPSGPLQRRGTMPKPNLGGLDGLLYDIENPDPKRKF